MSVGMSKTDGVTILTLTTDPHSLCPPLCQILGGLCYSPVCCSVSRHLKSLRTGSQTVLGVIQIMVGVLNIGLGAILMCSGFGSWWQMDEWAYPYWMGAIFVGLGVVSVLCERYPSPCLLFFHVFLHLVGVAFAIAAIILYATNTAHVRGWWGCDYNYDYGSRMATPTIPSEEKLLLKQKCQEGMELVVVLARGVSGVLVVVSILELCVVLSIVVLGIKTLRSNETGANKSLEDPESFKSLLSVTPSA